jgi:hypothetical protein
MAFKTGQLIVCVDDSIPPTAVLNSFSSWIKKNAIYTVREFKFMSLLGEYAVYLKEIENDPIYIEQLGTKVEPGYRASRFRPLEEILQEDLDVIEQEVSL